MHNNAETVLIFTATARDADLAAKTLEKGKFSVSVCTSPEILDKALTTGAGALVVAEEACNEPFLKILENFWAAQPAWSDFPVLFLQVPGARFESNAVKRLRARGNLVLLERPLHQLTLISASETALRARRRQYQARDFIAEKEADVRGRDEFLAMLGHELRNPLAAIRYAIGLMNEIDDNPQTKAPRDVIGRQTTHLASLVDDLLDVARVTRGKVQLALKPINLNDQIRKTIESLRASIEDAGHEVSFQPSAVPLIIAGDSVRVEQIFSNLIYNAVKYTPKGGRIHIELRQDKNHAIAVVQDDGIGMSEELLSRVFDLFSQAKSSIDRSRGGLGIGLTLVRGLVELHGGSISASSKGENCGSRFAVHFPLLQQHQQQSSVSAEAAHSGQHQILIIEDNDDAREILTLLLKRSGHKIWSASDGQDGLAKTFEHRPAVALIDIGLPSMNGYEVAEKIRADYDGDIFLVAVTGYGQPEDRQRALNAGFNEHLTKPVEASRLRELLNSIPV